MESLTSRSLADAGKVPVHNVPSKLVDIKNLPVLLGGVVFLVSIEGWSTLRCIYRLTGHCQLIVKFVATAFYNLYFHPLSKCEWAETAP